MGKHKQLTLLFLYVAQAIPMSFFSSVVPVILREEQFSLESIGLLQFIKLPWLLKVFWSPVVDSKTSSLASYKRWIVSAELFYAIVIAFIAFLHLETNFLLIAILMVVAITASATQDIATDALSIRMLDRKTHSLGASMQSMGGFIGSLIGAGLLLIIYQRFGWNSLLLGLAGFVLLALIPLLFYKKPLEDNGMGNKKKTISFAALLSFFRQKGIGKHLLFLVFYYAGIIASLAMLRPWLVDLGYSKETIGWLFGVGGTSIATIFSFLTGRFMKTVGKRQISLLVSVIVVIAMAFLSWVSFTHATQTYYIHAAISLVWMAYGMASVVVYSTAMGLVRKGYEGTDFTLQTVLVQLVGMVLAGVSGLIAGRLSYTALFVFSAGLSVFFLVYNGVFYRKHTT